MSIDKKNNWNDLFPAESWVDEEHRLLSGEPLLITRAKQLGLRIIDAMTGPILAAPVAAVAAGLLGLFNYSDVQAMDANHLPNHYQPRFDDMDLNHRQQMTDMQSGAEMQQIIRTNCPLNIFWIQGASPSTEGPVYFPSELPCTIDYSGGTPTLTFEELNFANYGVGPDQSAVLITPIAVLTADGRIPLLVNTHISGNATNGASILCPSDAISSWGLGNEVWGNGFTDSPVSTAACYAASEANIPANAFDMQGQAHPLNITVNMSGNMFIFDRTEMTASGILNIRVGDQINWPGVIQSSLMRGLRHRFGENVLILFAPEGVNPVADRFPVLVPNTPEPPPVIAPTEAIALPPIVATPVIESPQLEGIAAPTFEAPPPREIIGSKLSVKLGSSDGEYPDVYGIVDESLPAFQHLMQLYGSGKIVSNQQTWQLVDEIISSSEVPKVKNWFRNLFGKRDLPQAVRKLSSGGTSLDLSEVLFISQDQKNTFMLATLVVDEKTLYFLVNSKSALLEKFSFQLTDANGVSDVAGLQVFDNIQSDVPGARAPIYSRDLERDLIVTKSILVSGTRSGEDILRIAQGFGNEVVNGYQHTEEGLIPTAINLASIGGYTGKVYVHPADGKIYIGVAIVDETGLQTGSFLVPQENIDTKK